MSKEKLEQFKKETNGHISRLKKEIEGLQHEIDAAVESIEFNVYKDHNDAEGTLDERHTGYARLDCEGSYNCGSDEYESTYKIEGDDATYVGTTTFEYNRHDKTFYFVDGSQYTYKKVTA